MDIYWYAPFNNAGELTLARHVCRAGDRLLVQSLRSRFGRLLPTDEKGFDLVRNLPEPAGEGRFRGTILRRALVAVERAVRRDLVITAEFDILHVHTFNMFTDWAALRMLRRHGKPIVLWVHNVLPHQRRGPRSLENWAHKAGYRSVDHIVVAHPRLRTLLVEGFGLDPEKITVLPLLIPRVQRVCDVIREPKEFLFFGTLRSNKGLDVLLDAIRKLPPNLDVRFRFAGRGTPELHRLLLDAAASDSRICAELGWVSPARQAVLFSRAWAVLLPYTEFAAQSGVLTDAYSYRVPVIASCIGALGEAVRDDGSGWLVRPRDAVELARVIEDACCNDLRRAEHARRIDEIVGSRTAELLGPKLRDLYQFVALRHHATAGDQQSGAGTDVQQ